MTGFRDPERPLDRDTLENLFDELAAELRHLQARAHVYIINGAAMTMAFRRDPAIRDVDPWIDSGHDAILQAVHTIARRHGLPSTWLNEQATAFLPDTPDRRAAVVYDSPHLVITGASAEHLLAMKLEAARRADEADIATLLEILRIRDAVTALDIHAALFPDSARAVRARTLLETVLARSAPSGQPER